MNSLQLAKGELRGSATPRSASCLHFWSLKEAWTLASWLPTAQQLPWVSPWAISSGEQAKKTNFYRSSCKVVVYTKGSHSCLPSLLHVLCAAWLKSLSVESSCNYFSSGFFILHWSMGMFSAPSMQTCRWTVVGMLACLHLWGIGRECSDLQPPT